MRILLSIGKPDGSCKEDSECNTKDCFYCLSSGICGQYHREYCDTNTCGDGDGDCDPGTCPFGTACGVDNFLEYHPLLSACGGTSGAEVCVSSGKKICNDFLYKKNNMILNP